MSEAMLDPRMILIYALMEAFVHLVFYTLNKRMIQHEAEGIEPTLNLKDVLKGMLERLVLVVGLLSGYPHVITAFGALKIGTRIAEGENKVSNDYFLVGNLISILAAIVFVAISTKLT